MNNELSALRNNFKVTKKFLIAKFDCSLKNSNLTTFCFLSSLRLCGIGLPPCPHHGRLAVGVNGRPTQSRTSFCRLIVGIAQESYGGNPENKRSQKIRGKTMHKLLFDI